MKRVAPDPEFVLMYRKGIPTSKIAAIEGVAETTVRYHLQIAAREEPGIRGEHKAALPPPAKRTPEAGLRNLTRSSPSTNPRADCPSLTGSPSGNGALGVWLARRRQEAAEGTLSPAYTDALVAIPGWDRPSTRKADDEARWQRRLEEVQECRAAGGDWPRHQKTEDTNERALGVWLHVERMDYRAGRLDRAKENKLNELLPGWQEGRGHRGGRRL